jgi:hypothetical protein
MCRADVQIICVLCCQIYLFIYLFIYFSVWRLSPTHSTCKCLTLHLIALKGTHTNTHIHIFSTTPLDEWSALRRHLYLTKHSTQKRQTCMLLAGFEPTIPGSWEPQIHALDRAAIGTDCSQKLRCQFWVML